VDSPIACIVLPTYNEVESVPRLLALIFQESNNIATHELHVLVVDDDSPDGTGDYVRWATRLYPRLHLITGEKKGLGEAYRRGILHALKDFSPHLIVQMDADFQHDPALVPHLIRLCNSGYDLVIGSRFATGTEVAGLAWHRKFISLAGTKLVRWFSGIRGVTDCTSGFRCIRAKLLGECDFENCSMRGYSFQSWLLCELLRNGARYAEVPLPFPTRLYGHSKLTLRDKIEFLRCLFRLPRRRGEPSATISSTAQDSAVVAESISSEHRV